MPDRTSVQSTEEPAGIALTSTGMTLFVLGQYLPPGDASTPIMGVGIGCTFGGLALAALSGLSDVADLPSHMRPRRLRTAASVMAVASFCLAGVSLVGSHGTGIVGLLSFGAAGTSGSWFALQILGVASVYTAALASILFLADNTRLLTAPPDYSDPLAERRILRRCVLVPAPLPSGGGLIVAGRF